MISLVFKGPSMTSKAVGAVIFDGAGRVLLVQRGRAPLLGTWALPGGRVQSGETVNEAIEREVLEETRLEVCAKERIDTVALEAEGFSYEIEEFLCVMTRTSDPAIAGDDARGVRWATREELEGLGVTEVARGVIERARRAAHAGR